MKTGSFIESDIPVFDEGSGPAILIVHPGFDDGTAWSKVAKLLSGRFRVLRPVRRQYRENAKGGTPCSIQDEVRDILTVAETVGGPMVIVGHSSGGIVALETLLAGTSPKFAGAVIYEPPLVLGPPLGGAALERARSALASGKPAKAMRLFVRDIGRSGAALAWVTHALVALVPKYRRRVAHQLDDVEAIDALGRRLDAYRQVDVPVVIVQGGRSPAHLIDRAAALSRTVPGARTVVLRKQGHAAHLRDPGQLAAIIEDLADEVLPLA